MDSIFRPAFVLMSGRTVGFAAAFIIPIALARLFNLSEFGTYKQLFLIFSTLYGIGQLGMSESLFYFLPANPRAGGRYTMNAMAVLGLSGIVCLAALWFLQENIAEWLNNSALAMYLPLLGIFLVFMLISNVLENVMTTRKCHGQASITYAVSDLLRAGLFITPVLLLGSIESLLYGAIAFSALRLCVTMLYLYREYDGDMVLDFTLARAQLAYAAPFSIYVVIEVLQINLHMYFVSYQFDAAMFAIYAVGCLSIPLVDFLMGSTCNVMMVRMREHLIDSENRKVLAIWRDTTRKLMILVAPLVTGLVIMAHELIVGLFTENYERSVPIFTVWALVLLSAVFLTDGMLRVYSRIRSLMVLGLIKLVVLAAVIHFFMSAFGLVGAVMAVLLATVVEKVLALRRIQSVMRCSTAELLPWGSLGLVLILAAGATVPALVLKAVLSLHPLIMLPVIGAIYSVTYAGLLWRFGPIDEEEKVSFVQLACNPVAGLFGVRGAG